MRLFKEIRLERLEFDEDFNSYEDIIKEDMRNTILESTKHIMRDNASLIITQKSSNVEGLTLVSAVLKLYEYDPEEKGEPE